MLTLKQASEQTGKSKQAIQQAIKKGSISAKKNEKNEWCIDPSELFRVYEPINIDSNQSPKFDDALHSTLQIDNKVLQTEKRMQEEKIRMLENMIEDLKAEKEDWKNQAQKLLLQAPELKKGKQGFFSKVFG